MLEATEIIMPGQFLVYVETYLVCSCCLSLLSSLQEEYAKQFSTFKPDKKLRWLPHLGTVHLELQLQDRIVETNVPPLEAAFIELFSTQSKHSTHMKNPPKPEH